MSSLVTFTAGSEDNNGEYYDDVQARLLLASLLENFCSLYDKNPEKNSRLFLSLCRKLKSMGILRSSDFVEDNKDVRAAYRNAFRNLVLAAMNNEQLKGLPFESSNIIKENFFIVADNSSSEKSVYEDGQNNISFISPEEGRFLKDFVQIENIGKGGFGHVVKARNILDQRFYAIKVVSFSSDSALSFATILREVKSLASLDHPNVVRYYSAWIEDAFKSEYIENSQDFQNNSFSSTISSSTLQSNSFCNVKKNDNMKMFIQMELCYCTLEDYIKQRNSKIFGESNNLNNKKSIRLDRLVSIDTVTEKYTINSFENRRIFKGIVRGLHYIHTQGLMHRDLKPHNILFSGDSFTPKISDFGLASQHVHFSDFKPEENVSEISFLPEHTRGIGTYTYAPPEQLNGARYTEKTDVYSLGIIYFELFCPFRTAMEKVDVLTKLRNFRLFPTDFVKNYPKEVSKTIF